jgi:dTDP-glucose 4,6-dehydratase
MTEEHPLFPQSPYAGAKVGADRLAYSYYVTFQLPIIILRPFNNYGPHQYPEKLIPLLITNALEDKPMPIYGDGTFTRDWLYVEDLCKAVDKVIHTDIDKLRGEVINVGTGREASVNTIARFILERLGKKESLIKFVEDRPGHVKKLISSTSKAKVLLNWSAAVNFDDGIEKTIDWYVENEDWWRKLKK